MLSFFKSDKATPSSAEKTAWTTRLKVGLNKTRNELSGKLTRLFTGGVKIDQAFYEELESALLSADVGLPATEFVLDDLKARVKRESLAQSDQVYNALKAALRSLLTKLEAPLDTETQRPFVMMITGVNGVGKTTTIGKLAKYFQSQGKSVLLAAGDTFRAAAREQLAVWGERNNVTVIAQQGNDPGAVIFDAIQAAKSRGVDIVLADTAGRLPTQLHLMEEIKKIHRVIDKAIPGAPHEVLLVLDANTGQNALAQLRAFDAALKVTGLVITKLDGTAKGGVLAAIARTQAVPVRFIGVGEALEDLRPFNAQEFVEALFD